MTRWKSLLVAFALTLTACTPSGGGMTAPGPVAVAGAETPADDRRPLCTFEEPQWYGEIRASFGPVFEARVEAKASGVLRDPSTLELRVTRAPWRFEFEDDPSARPVLATARAAWWTEHVAAHGGADLTMLESESGGVQLQLGPDSEIEWVQPPRAPLSCQRVALRSTRRRALAQESNLPGLEALEDAEIGSLVRDGVWLLDRAGGERIARFPLQPRLVRILERGAEHVRIAARVDTGVAIGWLRAEDIDAAMGGLGLYGTGRGGGGRSGAVTHCALSYEAGVFAMAGEHREPIGSLTPGGRFRKLGEADGQWRVAPLLSEGMRLADGVSLVIASPDPAHVECRTSQ